MILPPAALKKIANAKSVAERAAVLKETVGEFDFCAQTPVQWIRKFESAVRSCFPDTVETETETFFIAYLPYMLNLKHRGWFFNVRNADESWVDFKKKFSAYFWAKFWNFAESTFQNEPEQDESLLVFAKAEIKRIKQLIPGLSEKATIMMCILSLPNETRPLLQEGLSESLEMFLSMVEAVDFQLGRAKRLWDDSLVEEAEPAAAKKAKTTESSSESTRNPQDERPASSSNASGFDVLLEKLTRMESNQSANVKNLVSKMFLAPEFEKMITKIVEKTKKPGNF